VEYVVAQNNTGSTRTGTLTIAGTIFTVTQVAGCSFDLNITSVTVPWEGVKATVRLTASNEACPWSSYSTTNWAQRYPHRGTGSTTIEYTIYPNVNTGGRPATIHIGGRTLNVFQAHNPLPADDRFVILMHFGFLGRLPSQAEMDTWVNALRTGAARTNVAVGLFNSQEFNNAGRFIAGLYVGILGRDAEFTGWLFQRSAYLSGVVTQLQLVTNFLGSQEYALKYGNPPDDEFVRVLYRNIFRREALQSELDQQVFTLRSGTSRAQLASNLLNSTEYRQWSGPTLTAFLQYACLLLRDAEQWERDYWADYMTRGMSVYQVFFSFINSAEMGLLLL
jgi:hypothetical protein